MSLVFQQMSAIIPLTLSCPLQQEHWLCALEQRHVETEQTTDRKLEKNTTAWSI